MAPKNTVIQSKDLKEEWELLGSKKDSVGKRNSSHKSYILFRKKIYGCGGGVATKAYAHYATFLHTHTHRKSRRTIKILIGYFQLG